MRRIPEIIVLLACALGCRRGADEAGELFVVKIGDAEARVEVAADPVARAAGLSGRRELGADSGMLFIFPEPIRPSFWMRNTHIPLSIAFITRAREIAEIHHMEPLTEDRHTPGVPVIMALEMPAGWFERHGVGGGDSVEIPREIMGIEAS